jgi:glycerophosphoryl diester phosphodiesterase
MRNILLDPSARVVIGHRGNRAHSPEDTLESMQEAVALGVDALEFDVHVTRDGTVVVHHDATLDRTTDARGPLAARTAAELSSVDAGYRFTLDGGRSFPWRGQGVRIPTLDAVLEQFPTLPLIIEIKTASATAAVRERVAHHAAERRVIIAGFDAASVRPLAGGPIALGACTADLIRQLPFALLGGRGPAAPFVAACIPPTHHGVPVPIGGYARLMRRRGGVVHVWTVNDADEAQRYWRLGVQGIISDDPATILRARDALGSGVVADR